MCCASRTLNRCYGSCRKLLSLGILLWRRLATRSMIDKFCLQPYNFHVPNLCVQENNPRRQLLQVSKCVPTLCWYVGISIWSWYSGRTGCWMFLAVTGEDRCVKTGNVFTVLDFPLKVGYTGKMEKWTTRMNDLWMTGWISHPMHHQAPEGDQRVWFCLGHAVPGVGTQVLSGISVISSPFQMNPMAPPQPLAEPLAAKVEGLQK